LGLAFGELKSRFGGWLNKNIVEIGGNFAIKIGGQAREICKKILGKIFFEKVFRDGLKKCIPGNFKWRSKRWSANGSNYWVAVGTEIATEVQCRLLGGGNCGWQ